MVVSGCYLLLAWCVWHPFMYRQQTNWEFVLETCTIMGGLLILLSQLLLWSDAAVMKVRPRTETQTAALARSLRAAGVRLVLVCGGSEARLTARLADFDVLVVNVC